jgi:transcriptional regulator with XRE-family HTH domain
VSGYVLDVAELNRLLDAQRLARGLSWRGVARDCGLSPSTLSRMQDGKRPDADALVTLLVWLDMDTDVARVIAPKGEAK